MDNLVKNERTLIDEDDNDNDDNNDNDDGNSKGDNDDDKHWEIIIIGKAIGNCIAVKRTAKDKAGENEATIKQRASNKQPADSSSISNNQKLGNHQQEAKNQSAPGSKWVTHQQSNGSKKQWDGQQESIVMPATWQQSNHDNGEFAVLQEKT